MQANKTFATIASGAVALLWIAGAQSSSADEFRIGLQAGIPAWSMDADAPLFGASATLEPDASPAAGVVGQYIIHSGDGSAGDFFVGVEAGIAAENGSGEEQIAILGTGVDLVAEPAWTMDVAWLAGFSLGEEALGRTFANPVVFGSVGASYAKTDLGVAVPALGLTGGDEAKHFGWKVGAGLQIDIGESATLQVRGNYAYYEARTYRDQGVSVDIEPSAFEVRATLLYRFDYCDLLGC